jgi:hypothetical protein
MIVIRPLSPDDKELVSKWLSQDEVHSANNIKWEDVTAPGTYAEIVSDEDGVILTVVRYHAALRVAIQFNPEATYRIAKNSKDIVVMLKQRARNIGAKEVIIRPGGKAIRFADKLGFIDFTGSKIVGV